MFSLYRLSKTQKIVLSLMIFFIFYQSFNLISSFYHSQRIDQQISLFEQRNEELKKEIIENKRQYIKSIIPSTQELLRKENLGEIIPGEKVIIIKDELYEDSIKEDKYSDFIQLTNIDELDNMNYPKKWLLFITGIKL